VMPISPHATLRQSMGGHDFRHHRAFHRGAVAVFASTTFSAPMSSAWSATIAFSRRFSSSSWRSLRISEISNPPYLLRQVYRRSRPQSRAAGTTPDLRPGLRLLQNRYDLFLAKPSLLHVFALPSIRQTLNLSLRYLQGVRPVPRLDSRALLDNVNLAGDLAGNFVWLKSDDVVKAIVGFARERDLDYPRAPSQEQIERHPSTLDSGRLIREARDFDIEIVRDES
jgi:hypothetical protein